MGHDKCLSTCALLGILFYEGVVTYCDTTKNLQQMVLMLSKSVVIYYTSRSFSSQLNESQSVGHLYIDTACSGLLNREGKIGIGKWFILQREMPPLGV